MNKDDDVHGRKEGNSTVAVVAVVVGRCVNFVIETERMQSKHSYYSSVLSFSIPLPLPLPLLLAAFNTARFTFLAPDSNASSTAFKAG